ncbi:MAG: response regulator [Candidatus Xenobia bacterium]
MNKIRVLLVDDHRLVRDLLVGLLQQHAEIEIVGMAASGDQALSMVESQAPHVVVLDLCMPGRDGKEVLRHIRTTWPDIKVLVLTALDAEAHLFDVLDAGVHGYLLKDSSLADLIAAIHAVQDGDVWLHPRPARWLVDRYQQSHRAPVDPDDLELLAGLRPREREVLRLLARGLSNRELGKALSITEKTAKTHVANLLRRIGAHDRFAAAMFAIRCGLGN